VNGLSEGIRKAEVALKWDPSPPGQPPAELHIVAATYLASDPYGEPAYVVRFDSRSPDGTISLHRHSKDGKGFGWDEVLTLELDRLDGRYARVVVSVVIQQRPAPLTFAGVIKPALRIREGYTVLAEDDFGAVRGATAATVGEFVRESGVWNFHPGLEDGMNDGMEDGVGQQPVGHTSPGPENDPDDDWPQES
jgi:stress response protein SCP2